MNAIPDDLLQTVQRFGQEHIFAFADQLSEKERNGLIAQVREIDFQTLNTCIEKHIHSSETEKQGELSPAPVITLADRTDRDADAVRSGQEAIRNGRVAAFVVAGGQGTRLGFNGPKGAFVPGLHSERSLFEIQAQRIQAAARKYSTRIPWYIMTSETNDRATRDFLEGNSFFGMRSEDVKIFTQGMMPAVDHSGNILLENKHRIFRSPNGHGGSLKALVDSGALDDMNRRGVDTLSYYQVDNILIWPVDPAFIGYHLQAESDMSSKVLPKRDPFEKVGNICRVNGRLSVVEYSDLPEELATATNEDGSLKFSAGSIGIHVFDTAFVRKMGTGGRLPYHKAEKNIPYMDSSGNIVEPEGKNGIKFEMFVFDALPEAENPVVLEVERSEEFAPIKNARGDDSPETAARALYERNARWLENRGLKVPKDENGTPVYPVELHPDILLNPEDSRDLLPPDMRIEGPIYIK